jgi:hypothetical protein
LDCVLPGVHRHEESERLGSLIPDSYNDVDARSRQFRRPSINCPGGPECPTDLAVGGTLPLAHVGPRSHSMTTITLVGRPPLASSLLMYAISAC